MAKKIVLLSLVKRSLTEDDSGWGLTTSSIFSATRLYALKSSGESSPWVFKNAFDVEFMAEQLWPVRGRAIQVGEDIKLVSSVRNPVWQFLAGIGTDPEI